MSGCLTSSGAMVDPTRSSPPSNSRTLTSEPALRSIAWEVRSSLSHGHTWRQAWRTSGAASVAWAVYVCMLQNGVIIIRNTQHTVACGGKRAW